MNTTFEQYKNFIDQIVFDEIDCFTFKNKSFAFIGDFTVDEQKRVFILSRLRGKIVLSPKDADVCVLGSKLKNDDENYDSALESLNDALDSKTRYNKLIIISEDIFNRLIIEAFYSFLNYDTQEDNKNDFLSQAFYNGAYNAWFDSKNQETKFYMGISTGGIGILVAMIPEILKSSDIINSSRFLCSLYLIGILGFLLSAIICGIIFKLNADVINEELKNNHHKSIAWIDHFLYFTFYSALTSTVFFFILLLFNNL